MKIKLVGATFYMNSPIYLTPIKKEDEVDLAGLEDKVVRILAAGVTAGLVTITEGKDEFLARIDSLKETKTEAVAETKPVKVTKEAPTEDVKPTEVPDEQPQEEVEAEKKPVAKKATTKATATKKAVAK